MRKPKTQKNAKFEKTNKLENLKLFFIIVNKGQGNFFINSFIENGVSSVFNLYGNGTAPNEIYEVLGMDDNKKDIVLAAIKLSDVEKVKKIIEERFNVSKYSKGVAFSVKIDSIAGVIAYKYLVNNRERVN